MLFWWVRYYTMIWKIFVLWLMSGWVLQALVVRRQSLSLFAALSLQHVAVGAQAAFLGALLTSLAGVTSPYIAAGVWATGLFALAIDSWLQKHFGLRLEASYVHFLRDLRLFDHHWGRHLAASIAAVLLAAVGAAGWLVATPAPAVSGTALLAWAALAAGCGFAAAVAWRHMPANSTYGWNNRLFGAQMAWWLGRLRQQRSAAASNVPHLFTSQAEEAEPVSPQWPLWRQTRAFVGPTHFSVRLEPEERPHVVMIFLESFGARDIGVLGSQYGITPCFDAWSKKGILWKNFYANGTTTARSALASLYGLPPRFTDLSAQSHNPPACVGLPDLFHKRGYRTAYFHNGPSVFEKKNPFFFDHGFGTMFDAVSLMKLYPGVSAGQWGPHDEALFRFHLEWLAQRHAAAVPTFSALFTVSNHHPFDVPRGAPTVPDDVHPNEMFRRFLRSMRYSDACLGAYLEGLQESGLAERTIVLVMADTGQEHQDDGGQGLSYSGRLTAAASRVPLLLLAPGRLQSALEINEMGSQVDVLPTLMDIFGMRDAHHSVGTSLRRVCATRRPFLVHGHAPQFMALHERPWTYTHNFDTATGALYNTELDSRESRDVAASHPAHAHSLQQDILAARGFCDQLYETNAFAPADSGTSFAFPRVPLDAAGQVPEGYPSSLQDMAARRAQLAPLVDPPIESVRERRFLQIYLNSKLSDADKLLAAQLQYKAIYFRELGILTTAEIAERQRLQQLLDEAMFGPNHQSYRPRIEY